MIMASLCCCVCQTTFNRDNAKLQPYPGARERQGAPQNILYCPHCGLGMANPMPTQAHLDILYNDSGFWGKTEKLTVIPRHLPVPFGLARARWQVIRPHLNGVAVKSLRILDIGAGHGCMGLTVKQLAGVTLARYTVVEPDAALRSNLADTWVQADNPGQLQGFSTLDKVEGTFDLIVLSHILEHLIQPLPFLEKVRSLLDGQGLLFIDVPHQDFRFKSDVFPHLQFFAPDHVRLLVEKLALESLEISTWGRSWQQTPLRHPQEGGVGLLRFMEKLVNKFKKSLPESVSLAFFSWYFGFSDPHPRGTWIRAVARLATGTRPESSSG